MKKVQVFLAIALGGWVVSFSVPAQAVTSAESKLIGGQFALATRGASDKNVSSRLLSQGDLRDMNALVALSPTNSGPARLNAKGATSAGATLFSAVAPAVVLVISEDGIGSGVVVSADGEIVTNHHVVGDAKTVEVAFLPLRQGGKPAEEDLIPARVVKVNDKKDLALLKVRFMPCGLKPIELVKDQIAIGDEVHAIGHPKGQLWSYTRGYVSQLRDDYVWQGGPNGVKHQASVIQTQTPINPGNSGGPLFNNNRQLVGINSFGKTESEGLNYAIATSEVMKFLSQQGSVVSSKPVKAAETKPETKKKCGKEPVNTLRSENKLQGKVSLYQFDGDCDGKIEAQLSIADDKTKPNVFAFDTNGDGKFDVLVLDRDQDGKWDVTYYDTDHDGKPDHYAINQDGKLKASGELTPMS